MKLRIEVEGQQYSLALSPTGAGSHYELQGAATGSGTASVSEIVPGVFSILIGHKSCTVALSPAGDALEVVSAGRRRFIRVADARDRSPGDKQANPAGPAEIKAQMPGKVIHLLVNPGDTVEAGQGLIVVEAMKMQNEMKAPKSGTVVKIDAREGATVAAGQRLLTVE